MRCVAWALGLACLAALAACSSGYSEPFAQCTVSIPGPAGPFFNESKAPVFLGSTAPPKDLALESLTLSENAELLVPEVFGQTAVVSKVPPGGVIAIVQAPV